jgi:ATP-binding cassette, subfamily F, member 3
MQILHIEQEVKADSTTAIELILKTDVERERLLEEEKKALETTSENSNAVLSKIYERMDEIDAHNAEARAATS